MSALKSVTFYRAATLLLLFFCAGHTIGGMLLQSSRGAEADAVFEAMKTVEFNFNGATCTWYNFWFGFGLGSWPWAYPRYAIIDPVLFANHAHNDWAEWAADGGLPFALLIGLVALRAAGGLCAAVGIQAGSGATRSLQHSHQLAGPA